MMRKNIFFILLLIIVILLFAMIFLIGILNYIEAPVLYKMPWLQFNKTIAFFYLIIFSIFFILSVTIMLRVLVSLKHEQVQLTSMNVDDLSIQKKNSEFISESFDKLVNSLNKNISAIKNYTEIIDSDMEKVDQLKLEAKLQDVVDTLVQDFSQMINDFVQVTSIKELLEKILFWGVSFSKSRRGSIMVVDSNKELYILKTIGWNENDESKISDIRIPLGSGIAGKVAAENKRIFVTNLENYANHDFLYKDKYQSKSFISMPIFGIKKVVAVLNLTESKNGLYSMNELEILNIITRLSSKIFELLQLKKKIMS